MTTPESPNAAGLRPDLLGLSREQLAETLAGSVDRRFRIDQIYRALHERGAMDFESMTELSRDLRQHLAGQFRIENPDIESSHEAADGTVKYLFRLHDGATIEAVDIPDGKRRTLCWVHAPLES